MAERGMSAAMLAEIVKEKVAMCYLVKIEPDHATYTFTDYGRSLVYDSETYVRTFGLLGFSEIVESSKVTVEQTTISLAGVDKNEALAAILTDDFINRPISIWLAFLNASDAIISDPLLILKGLMDSPTYNEDPESGTAIVTITATNNFRDFDRARGVHTNYNEQKFYYSSDEAFEFVSEIPKIIDWGRA